MTRGNKHRLFVGNLVILSYAISGCLSSTSRPYQADLLELTWDMVNGETSFEDAIDMNEDSIAENGLDEIIPEVSDVKPESSVDSDVIFDEETFENEIIQSMCGNGKKEDGELCDDGENNGSYGYCKDDCSGMGPYCGNGIIEEPYEECDFGMGDIAFGICSDTCKQISISLPPSTTGVTSEWIENPPPCSLENWFVKYLHYRIRLFGNGTEQFPGFLSLGKDHGQSIPASFREPHINCANDWWLTYSGCQLKEGFGKMRWGDATIWLGDFIGVLASEYAVFKLLGLDTNKTVEALFYALMAVNRVDEYAEIIYGTQPKLDGFFIRDDVPTNFYELPDGTLRFPGYHCVQSAGSCGKPDINEGYFTSQDQMIGLIYGLAMVHRFLPDGVIYNGIDLRYTAREMVHRMVNHLRSNGWQITDPLGNHPPDKWGGNAIGFSNQFAKVANIICGKDFGIDDYRDTLSKTLGESIFLGLEAIWDETHDYNRTMAFILVTITGDWNSDKVAKKAVDDAKDIFSLVYALHHGTPVGKAQSLWRIESLLTSAPCSGPCHKTPGCEEANGWKGSDRTKSPDERLGNKHYMKAEFNGLDYMLLHNLYFLYQKGKYGFAVLDSNVKDCSDFDNLSVILGKDGAKSSYYDPKDPCTHKDMNLIFCGRKWSSWLADALSQKVTIFTGAIKWNCSDGKKCILEPVTKVGTDGNDLILGTPGNDILDGGEGDDCIYGFGGKDVLVGGGGADEIHGGDGDDQIFGDEKAFNLSGGPDILWGEGGNDYIKGGPHMDELYGGDGDDQIIGDSGNDFIEGDEGNDYLKGDSGDDMISGGMGNDEIHGDSGDDVLDGEGGNDKIDGDSGSDWIWGGGGNNFLKGGAGDDRLFGDEGEYDILCGNGGDDDLWGNWDGKDKCLGGGWFLGGKDSVNGCVDGSASESDCTDSAFSKWKP